MSDCRDKNQNIVDNHSLLLCLSKDFSVTVIIKLDIILLRFDMANVSEDSVSPFQQLPAEILFRIFDSLDAVTLLLSLGQTCRRLRTLVHDYDRISVDFTLISKPQFHCLLGVIDPHRVTSLTLTHQSETLYAVSLFSSHYRQRPFDRLQSLALHRIPAEDLQNILECVQSMSLTWFTLTTEHYLNFLGSPILNPISPMISRSHLHRLEMDLEGEAFTRIRWPTTNTIKQLRFSQFFDINELRTMLAQLPHLQILSVNDISKNFWSSEMKVEGSTEPFRQLTSLTLEKCRASIDELEYVLSLTSSLTHLKLVSTESYEDGQRWEQFIQLNLPHLIKFEFFFPISGYTSYLYTGVESITPSFRTPFWLEQKKWLVQEGISDRLFGRPCLNLFSLPICIDRYDCVWELQKNALSRSLSDDPSWMDNVTTLEWYANTAALTTGKENVMIRWRIDLSVVSFMLSSRCS